MAKSPYRRQSRRLFSLAGRADRASEQPVLEMLEERRLLTTLTIPDSDTPLGPALDADGYAEAVFFTWYTQPALTYDPDTEVGSLAIGVRFVLSGTPGASVEIKDLFGRDMYFRPTPESLAPPRVTFEEVLEGADGALGDDGYEFAPSGSAAYATDPEDEVGSPTDSIESVVEDLNGDGLAEIVTVNASGPNAVTWQFGLGEAETIDDDSGEVTPAEPDGTFGDLINEDADGNEEPAQQAIGYVPFGPTGASGLAVADLTGDEFPEIIVTFRNSDQVGIYENLGEELVDPEGDEYNWLGFGPATLVDVGDQPIDVEVDSKGDIWVLNYGDETVQRVTTAKSTRDIYTITGSLADVTLIDADNDGVGDGIDAAGDDMLTIGRSGEDTTKAVLSFELPAALLDAVSGPDEQYITKVTLLVGGQEPDPDTGYNVRLYMTGETTATNNVVIGDYEDDRFDVEVDSETVPFLSPDSDTLDDAGVSYQLPFGKLTIELLQDAADNDTPHLQFRLEGDHNLFGIDESDLTPGELDELNSLSSYRINSADAGLTETIPTLTITLSETFQGDDVYAVGSEPTSLLIEKAQGAAPAPDDEPVPDMVVTHAGSDDVWIFVGSDDGDKFIFGDDDSNGDGSRAPAEVLSTQPPGYINPIADIDGDGVVDPIGDDSNPWEAAVGDIDGDGALDLTMALRGNMYPGISVFTSGGAELANTLIPGGVAVFWGATGIPGAVYADYDSNRPGTQPDFLQDSFLSNQPTPFLTLGFTTGATLDALELDPFYRGPSSIVIANVNPHVDFRLNETYAAMDLVVGSIDPYNAVTNPDHGFFNLAATRGGVYTLTQRHDAQSEYDGFTYLSYASPATTNPLLLNSPLIDIDSSTIIPGRLFDLPLEHDTAKDDYAIQAPDLLPIEYIDVVVADLEPSALDTPLLDEEVPVPELVVTRPDNESPYWRAGEDPAIARNVQVLWQIEGEADPLPVYNYGIGSIEFSNADANTTLTVTAGAVHGNLVENEAYLLEPGALGLIASFEMWAPLTIEDGPDNLEYLEGSGAIRIGAPSNRPFTVDALEFYADYTAFYTDPTQGIKAEDGQSINQIIIDGHVYGRNVIDGSLETFSAGFLAGDLIVAGDAGLINIATYSGYIDPEDPGLDADPLDDDYQIGGTGNIIQVGRTLGDFYVGRTLYSEVQVLGEVSDLDSRPALDPLRVVEAEARFDAGDTITIMVDPASGRTRAYNPNEYSYHRAPGMALEGGFNSLSIHHGDPLAGDLTQMGMTIYTDGGILSNDTLGTAHFIGGQTTAVEVAGWLTDSIGDSNDVFSFAVEKGSEVDISFIIEALSFDQQVLNTVLGAEVYDREGNLHASLEAGRSAFTFTAPYSGVFYIALQVSPLGGGLPEIPYTLSMQGLAPVTMGQVRTGAAIILLGGGAINTAGGSIGHIASGQAPGTPGGTHEGLDGNDPEDVGSILAIAAGVNSIISAGDIYGITVGGDVIFSQFSAGGDIGAINVGYSDFANDGSEGDWWGAYLQADNLAYMNLTGSLGGESTQPDLSQDTVMYSDAGFELRGSIGTVRVGEHLMGEEAFFELGPNSTFDQLIVEGYTRTG
ncbi:MAG: hypothetical protein ACF8NJ_05020, partial [Phycisphaerales bacterium JB038]